MKKNTREAILEAAWDSLLKNGISGTSAEDIAAAVGIARSSFYRYFKGMEHIIAEIVLARGKRDLSEVLTQSLPHAASGSLWVYFVFYAVQGNLKDPLRKLLREENIFTVDLVYAFKPNAFDELAEIILPTIEADQQRGELLNLISAESIAEWLLRLMWSLSNTPPPKGNWTDSSLLQYIRNFVVPGIMPPQSKLYDTARISEQLDDLKNSMLAIENKINAIKK